MTPLLEKAIRAGKRATIETEGRIMTGSPRADLIAAAIEIAAPHIIAAALADDEATVEVMARAFCCPDGCAIDVHGGTFGYCQKGKKGNVPAALAALRRLILGDQA